MIGCQIVFPWPDQGDDRPGALTTRWYSGAHAERKISYAWIASPHVYFALERRFCAAAALVFF
jgi:hypothetical protein